MFVFSCEFAAGVADDGSVQSPATGWQRTLGVCSDGQDCPRLLSHAGIHTAPTSVHFCSHLGGFSGLPVLVCNPKGAVKCHTPSPCGRNVIGSWIVPARESFHGRV